MILELHMQLTRDWKETIFVWVLGHVGIRANSALAVSQSALSALKINSVTSFQSYMITSTYNENCYKMPFLFVLSSY